jgi:hypothetical protein
MIDIFRQGWSTGRKHLPRVGEGITPVKLLSMSLDPVVRRVKCWLLRAHLRSLHRLADYFAWQQENGAAGLADTHKRIAMTKSDLRSLQ